MTMLHTPTPATPAPPGGGRSRGRSALTALALVALLGAAGTLAACNTTAGVGEDLSAAGDALAGSAERNKGY